MVNTQVALDDVLNTVVNHLQTKYGYGAVGSGTTAATVSDTALENELLRKALQGVQVVGTNKIVYTLYIDETELNGQTISEMGVFDASTGGTMLCRNTFAALNKTADIEVWIEVEESVEVTQ